MIAKGITKLNELIGEITLPNYEHYLIICDNPKAQYEETLAQITSLDHKIYTLIPDPKENAILYGYMFFIFRKQSELKTLGEMGLDLCLFHKEDVTRSKEFNLIVRPNLAKRHGKAYQFENEIKAQPRQKRSRAPKG